MTSIRSGPPPASPAPPRPFPRRAGAVAVAALALLALIGCEKEEIREYKAARADASRTRAKARAATKRRLLAVIAPQGENIWVFKFLGPVEEINEQAKHFDAFVASLEFEDKGTAKWTIPEGWEEEGPKGMRQATLYAGPKGNSLEVTVFKFPKSPILDNVNRWRSVDLALSPIGAAGLEKVARKRTTKAGTEVTVVDMIGLPPRGKGPPMARGAHPPRPLRVLPLTYKAPLDWEERAPKVGALTLVSFRVRQGAQAVEVTIGKVGREFAMRDNVNVWRSQVGLADLSEADFKALTFPKMTVDTLEGPYLDLSGPKGRMLLVLTRHLDNTYFFKMMGDKPLVEKQKPAFEAFLKTVQFRGALGADDE